MNANRPAPKARNVKAQAERACRVRAVRPFCAGTSAGLGLRPHTNHEPCKGGILRVTHGLMPPLQGSSHFFDVTQGCAPSSLPLGFYITGPSALHFAAIPAPKVRNVIAQAKRACRVRAVRPFCAGTSAGLGLRPHTNHEPCRGGIVRVARGFIPPLHDSSHFSDMTQGCAPSSLPLGFYIAGPSALTVCG